MCVGMYVFIYLDLYLWKSMQEPEHGLSGFGGCGAQVGGISSTALFLLSEFWSM